MRAFLRVGFYAQVDLRGIAATGWLLCRDPYRHVCDRSCHDGGV
jgi:hypothetical protein